MIEIEGTKMDGENDVDVKFEESEKEGKFVYFKDYDENITKWIYLKVKTTKIWKHSDHGYWFWWKIE